MMIVVPRFTESEQTEPWQVAAINRDAVKQGAEKGVMAAMRDENDRK